MAIVRFALRFPHTFYVVAALILFLGVTAAIEMLPDIFSEINIPVVSVIWQYTGLNTTEMEERVTTYSQYAMSSNVNGIRDIEAETVNGISVQKIYFQPSRRSSCSTARRQCRCCRSASVPIGSARRSSMITASIACGR